MNNYLIPALLATPELIEQQFRTISIGDWDTPTHPDRFSSREVLAHLADWEPILLARMKCALESDSPTIPAYDEGQMALDNHYDEQDPVEALRTFREARQRTIHWLRELREQDYLRTVQHPERGVLTVDCIGNMIACHDVYHLKQLADVSRNFQR